MAERRIRLRNQSGLHARPAHRFAEAVAQTGHAVFVRKANGVEEVNAASILSVLTLDCRYGDEIVIRVEGPTGEEVVSVLEAFIEDGLGEAPAG